MTQKKKRILSIVLAAALVAAGLWYTRPRTLAEIIDDEISGISIGVTRFSNDMMGIGETRQENFSPGGEDYQTVYGLFEDLRFRRTIFRDAAYHINDLLGKYGTHEIRAGDYRGYFAFFTGEDYTFALDLGFWDGEWSIHQKEQFHIVTLVARQDTALNLHAALWEMLPEETA